MPHITSVLGLMLHTLGDESAHYSCPVWMSHPKPHAATHIATPITLQPFQEALMFTCCAGTFLVPHITSVLGMVLRALGDESAQLRKAAILALIAVCPWLVDEAAVKAFQAHMPQLLQVTDSAGSCHVAFMPGDLCLPTCREGL